MRRLLLLALILALADGLVPHGALAQAPVQTATPDEGDRNLVTTVDCGSSFPTCTFTLSVPGLTSPLVPESATANIDFKMLELQRPAEQVQPLQVQFVLDAPANVRQRQIPQRFVEAVRKLLDAYKLAGKEDLLNQDWWSAQVIGAEAPDRLTAIADWQYGDYGGFINMVDGYINETLPPKGPQTTSIFGPVLKALQGYEGVHSTRVLVLFSDGYDTTSSVSLDDLIAAAQTANVRVYTVQHLAGGDTQSRTNLERLAEETGGQFLTLENVGDLAPLWKALLQEQAATTYTFALPDAEPRSLTVGVNRQDGERLAEAVPMPPVKVPPLQIEGVTVNGSTGDQLELAPDTQELSIQLKLGAGSGDIMARIERVEYTLGEQIFVQQAPPFDTYTLPLQGVALGDMGLPLAVKVYDRYGPVQTSSTIAVRRQPLPTPTTPSTAAAAVTSTAAASGAGVVAVTNAADESGTTTEPAPGDASVAQAPAQDETQTGADPVPVAGAGEAAGGVAGAATGVEERAQNPQVAQGQPTPEEAALAGQTGDGVASVVQSGTGAGDAATGGSAAASVPGVPAELQALLARIGLRGQTGLLVLGSAALTAVLLGILLIAQLRPPRKKTLTPVRPPIYRPGRQPAEMQLRDDDDGTQPAEVDADGTNPVQDIFARARLELVPDKNDKNDAKLREEIRFYPKDASAARQEWKIGRSYEYCDYVIDDPHKRISRLHATIIEEGERFSIRDEGSAGGTYINKRKLTPQIPQQLQDNDLINLNIVAYRFFVGDELGVDPDIRTDAGTNGDPHGTESKAKSRFTPDPDQTEKAENDLF